MKKPSKYCSFLAFKEQSALAVVNGSDVLLPMMNARLTDAKAVGTTLVSWLLTRPERFEDALVRSPYTKQYFVAYVRELSMKHRERIALKLTQNGYIHTRQFAQELQNEA